MEEGIGKAFLFGFSMNGKQYIRLLALTCILFGIGLLISIAFHYATADVLTHIMKVLFFTAMEQLAWLFLKRLSWKEADSDEKICKSIC